MNFFHTYKNKLFLSGLVVVLLVVATYVYMQLKPIEKVSQQVNAPTDTQLNPLKEETSQKVDSTMTLDYIKDFDLGELNTTGMDGELLKIAIKGKVAIPKSDGDNPIVFLLPSSHDDPFMNQVYDNVLDEIASLNYLGVFLDVRDLMKKQVVDIKVMQEVFDRYRMELVKAIAGEESAFNVEIYNKGTLSDVIFISYGESLETAYSIIDDQMSKQQFKLDRLLFINPIKKSEISLTYPDVYTAFLIDDHLSKDERLGSQFLFEEYRQEKSRKSVTNYSLAQNLSLFGSDPIETKLEDENTLLYEDVAVSDQDILSFMSGYIHDFLSTQIESESVEKIAPSSDELPIKVKTSTLVPNMLRLINPAIEVQPTLNTLGGENILTNVILTHQSEFLSTFKMDIVNYPASFKMLIPTEPYDLSHYDFISLYGSISSNDQTSNDSVPKIKVMLEDVTGQTSAVEIVMSPIDYTNTLDQYCLSDIRLSLSDFKELDLTSIVSIEIVFEESFAYQMILGDISLVKTVY